MLIHDPFRGEKGEHVRKIRQIPSWASGELAYLLHKMRKMSIRPDSDEVRGQNEDLIERIKESKGTAPEKLLEDKADSAIEFLGRMQERGMPGSSSLRVGEEEYVRAYCIGVGECSFKDGGQDDTGAYYPNFGPEIYLCDDGRLRAAVDKTYEQHAFTPLDFPFEPGLYSDVSALAGDFTSGTIDIDGDSGESRFYPAPLPAVLDNISASNPAEGGA